MQVRDMKYFMVLVALGVCLTMGDVGADGFILADNFDITVPNGSGSGSGWYGAQSDQSVTPGCVASQLWDLEGMFASGDTTLDNTTITLVGGWDFKNGVDGEKSGDIFVDTNAGTDGFPAPPTNVYRDGNRIVANTFGYDYVMHILDWDSTNIQYEVFHLTPSSLVRTVAYGDNGAANPWIYVSGGTALNGGQLYNVTYQSGLSDAETGFKGDLVTDKNGTDGDDYQPAGPSHYAASVNLSWLAGVLPVPENVGFHFTEECGNDNLMGEIIGFAGDPVPEPASLVLMALAVGGLVARRVRGRHI